MSDIPALAEHFLKNVCAESKKKVHGFTDEAMQALQRYRWPGNVREMQNVIERAVLLGKNSVIGVEDLPTSVAAGGGLSIESVGTQSLKQALSAPEKQLILETLEAHNWNRQLTAAALGINRTTLYKKMKRLGLEEVAVAMGR
jgi:DNA-binding NtrC family response regulator